MAESAEKSTDLDTGASGTETVSEFRLQTSGARQKMEELIKKVENDQIPLSLEGEE